MSARELIISRIKSLEAQLQVLQARVQSLPPAEPSYTFADLYGLLSGKVESSEEEMDAILHGRGRERN